METTVVNPSVDYSKRVFFLLAAVVVVVLLVGAGFFIGHQHTTTTVKIPVGACAPNCDTPLETVPNRLGP